MRRTIALLTMAALLAIAAFPLGLVAPQSARAASTITVETVERDSGDPVPYACYTVADLNENGNFNGGVGGDCDEDGDGTTQVDVAPCDPCRVTQGLPDQPNDQPTDYLLEPDQEGGADKTAYTFRNFLKPFLVVTVKDARTGKLVEGACISVAPPGGGGVAGGCDGDAADLDEQSNGKVQTKRVLDGDYNVTLTRVPTNYVDNDPSQLVTAEPAKTGEFESVTFNVKPKPKIVIKTVDSKSGKRLKGACYAIAKNISGGGLGTFCDGVKNGTSGDQDGVKNGIIVTRPLDPDSTYIIDQTTPPRGYRPVPNKQVTTVAGQDAEVTIKNRPKR